MLESNGRTRSKSALRQNLLDFSIALLLVANSWAWLLPVGNGALVVVVAVVLVLFSIGSGLKGISYKPIYIVLASLLLFVETFVYLGFTDDFDKATRNYFLQFMALGVPSLFMATTKFRPVEVVKMICVLSIPLLFYVRGIDMHATIDYGYWMGISYGILTYILALLLYVFFIGSDYGLVVKFGLLLALFLYISFYVEYASRGALLAVFVSVMLFYFVKKDYSLRKALLLMAIGVLILYFSLFVILQYMYEELSSIGIDSFALKKMLFMDDITNGRADILAMGIDLFLENPVIGSGVGAFERMQTHGYVHNCIIQFLDEGGIVYCAIMTGVIIKSFMLIFSKKIEREERFFMAFLVSSGFIGLLFSSYFWGAQCFWFMIGYTILEKSKLKNKRYENSYSSI